MYGKSLSYLMLVVGSIVLFCASCFAGKVPGMENYSVYSQNPVEVLGIALLSAVMIFGGIWGIQRKHHC